MASASIQLPTPALRQWILEQTRAGHSAAAVLEAMRSSGWGDEVARRTLLSVLGSLPPEAPASSAGAVRVPEPALDDAPASLWAHDREVQVLLTLREPRIVVFADLLSDAECDEMVALAQPRLARSHTVDTATGDSEVNVARTSEGMFFARGEHPVCARLEARIAALLRWPLEFGEGLQVLHYRPGAEYRPHYDYFDPAQPGTPAILKRGGQRVATVLIYLNTPRRGGATSFPDVGLEVAPRKGCAVFFAYDRPHPDTRSLHGGAPMIEGEKWIATKWLRERRFD